MINPVSLKTIKEVLKVLLWSILIFVLISFVQYSYETSYRIIDSEFDRYYFAVLGSFGVDKLGFDASALSLFQPICTDGIGDAVFLELLKLAWI